MFRRNVENELIEFIKMGQRKISDLSKQEKNKLNYICRQLESDDNVLSETMERYSKLTTEQYSPGTVMTYLRSSLKKKLDHVLDTEVIYSYNPKKDELTRLSDVKINFTTAKVYCDTPLKQIDKLLYQRLLSEGFKSAKIFYKNKKLEEYTVLNIPSLEQFILSKEKEGSLFPAICIVSTFLLTGLIIASK